MNAIILFSGQGLQKIEQIQELKSLATPCQYELLTKHLSQLFINSLQPIDIYHNQLAQPFIYSLQYLRWQHIAKIIDTPIAFAGYSLGEASAVCCSADLDFEQGLHLIKARANLMQSTFGRACGMLAIQGLTKQQIDIVTSQTETFVAIVMTHTQVIVGGYHDNLQQAATLTNQLGATALHWLNVSVPSHTPILARANHQFYEYLNGDEYLALQKSRLRIPIISTTDGVRYQDSQQAIQILAHQIDHTLNWQLCMETIQEYQPDIIIEIGPGNALSRMVNNELPHIPCRGYDEFRDINGIKRWFERNGC